MSVNATQRKLGRLQLCAIAAVFLGPLLIANYMYWAGMITPGEPSNNGLLFDPIVSVRDELPGSALHSFADGKWVMLYASDEECESMCRESLFRMRQTHLMVGRDMDRIVRIFLHGDSPLDTAFLQQEHPDLKTIDDSSLASLLEEKRPDNLISGGIYLIDPHANLVMYFPPALDPPDLVEDVRHLLKLSRIG